jgi:hypothetical protein
VFVPCALITYALTCHGDRLVSARFGPAGGLSQPRRDTVDPKTFHPDPSLTGGIRPRATEQYF